MPINQTTLLAIYSWGDFEMTAIGLVLLVVGVLGIILGDREVKDRDLVLAYIAICGIALLLIGVVIKLWEIMP